MGGERWVVSTASSRTALQGYELDKFMSAAVIRVETRLGHPGHILSWSSKSDSVYKYPSLIWILHWIMCINNSAWS